MNIFKLFKIPTKNKKSGFQKREPPVNPQLEKFKRAVNILENEYCLKKTIFENSSIDKNNNPIPWFTYPALEYLKQFDLSKTRIFEFGSGNTTLYWSKVSKEVFSVEDNPDWFNKINKHLKKNVHLILKTNKIEYCEEILKYHHKFDIIVIDGKYRDVCCKNAVKKISRNGIIILDDAERVSKFKDYYIATKTLKKAGLIQIDFCGFNPINDYTKATSIFMTRDFNFKQLKTGYQPINVIGQI